MPRVRRRRGRPPDDAGARHAVIASVRHGADGLLSAITPRLMRARQLTCFGDDEEAAAGFAAAAPFLLQP